MDIKQYIESGIIEQYVLGLLSEEERTQVELRASEYPEINDEIVRVEIALEAYARSMGINPPEDRKGAILAAIGSADVGTQHISNDKVTPNSLATFLTWMLSLLVAGALLLAYHFYHQGTHKSEDLERSERQFIQLQTSYDSLSLACQETQNQYAFFRDAQSRKIVLGGTDLSPTSVATVHYNPRQQQAYLDVVNLPAPPAGKQYQLWAIVDGQPVDMGVFNASAANLLTVPFIENPQAFAVTLEDAGGVPAPTMDQMYVIGELS